LRAFGAYGKLFNLMVEFQSQSLDRTLAALADPTRRAIIERLRHGEARVTALAEPFNMSLNAVSKHLQVLERAGLMRRTVRGREHLCALRAAPMREATEWIERYRLFWEEQLDSLEEYLLRDTRPVRKPRGKK
jgi:DNA-binding transcriptional ArsR family regulator